MGVPLLLLALVERSVGQDTKSTQIDSPVAIGMAALGSFKTVCSPLQLLLLLLLKDLVEPSQPQIIGPKGRIMAGSWASFLCSANDFSSKAIKVLWSKDGETIQHNKTRITSSEVKGRRVYRVESKVAILLLNASVMVICNAESFYPENASIGLFAKDDPSGKGMVAPKILNPDGTFSYKSFMEVRATEERNSSVFLCQVKQYSQLLVNKTTRLFITRPLKRSE
ncbi:hypothetical protein E2320_022803, partial [Naja naja]